MEDEPQSLLAYIPALKNVPPTLRDLVYLVDIPGFADAKKHVAEIADKSAITSPSYVYVVSYRMLEDERDVSNFKMMLQKDKGNILSILGTLSLLLGFTLRFSHCY